VQILTVLGSPRLRGNTATVLGCLEQRLAGEGHRVERINVVEQEVHGCLGCGTCQRVPEALGCAQGDDAVGIFRQMMAADAVVYATPVYTYGFPSQMKALIDREYCLVTGGGTPAFRSLLQGKRTALLVTCGGAAETSADLLQEVFQREGEFQGWDIAGKFVVPNCGRPEELGDRATEMAARVAADLLAPWSAAARPGRVP
jgi:multimeric flavodoxin WrbA